MGQFGKKKVVKFWRKLVRFTKMKKVNFCETFEENLEEIINEYVKKKLGLFRRKFIEKQVRKKNAKQKQKYFKSVIRRTSFASQNISVCYSKICKKSAKYLFKFL